MAESTVNPQITDAVTQTNVKVVAEAPAQAIASLYQVASHSIGISLQNAVHSQQVLNQISTAVVSKAATMIMAIGESASGGGSAAGGGGTK
ncbi:MAG: RebB family R body protein [Pseudomonadota bacterium]|jgi:hypothetical protein